MNAHGLLRDPEAMADILIAETFGKLTEHFDLTRGQFIELDAVFK